MAEQVKHTLGPWVPFTLMIHRAQKATDTKPEMWECPVHTHGDSLQSKIAHTARGLTQEEAEANACLIAAAPKMLAALKVIPDPHHEGFCDSCTTVKQLPLNCENGRHFFQHDDTCWYGQIQATIAKAEGR